MARLRAGKHVTEEVHALMKERANIEEDYGKRLTKLAKTFSPKEEIGWVLLLYTSMRCYLFEMNCGIDFEYLMIVELFVTHWMWFDRK